VAQSKGINAAVPPAGLSLPFLSQCGFGEEKVPAQVKKFAIFCAPSRYKPIDRREVLLQEFSLSSLRLVAVGSHWGEWNYVAGQSGGEMQYPIKHQLWRKGVMKSSTSNQNVAAPLNRRWFAKRVLTPSPLNTASGALLTLKQHFHRK